MNRKYIIIAIVVAVAAGSLWRVTNRPPALASGYVNYDENAEGYLSRPDDEEQHPALILIHEWWGLNADIRTLADDFAVEGYVVLAVDLYDGERTTEPERARALASAVRADVSGAFANLNAAIDYLRDHPNVDGERLAAVGWCFGGGWAYEMAVNDLDIAASVMYYGQFDAEDDFAHMRQSILGHFGEEDSSIAVDDVREFQAALETVNGTHQVYIYPNVGHGFANYRGGDNLAYSEEAAETAWERTLDFLKDALRR